MLDRNQAHKSGVRLNFRDGDGLVHTNRDATLATAAFIRVAAHNEMVVFDFVNFVRANAHAFATNFALRFVYSNGIHFLFRFKGQWLSPANPSRPPDPGIPAVMFEHFRKLCLADGAGRDQHGCAGRPECSRQVGQIEDFWRRDWYRFALRGISANSAPYILQRQSRILHNQV